MSFRFIYIETDSETDLESAAVSGLWLVIDWPFNEGVGGRSQWIRCNGPSAQRNSGLNALIQTLESLRVSEQKPSQGLYLVYRITETWFLHRIWSRLSYVGQIVQSSEWSEICSELWHQCRCKHTHSWISKPSSDVCWILTSEALRITSSY